MPGDTPKVLCFVARALSSGPGIISPLTWVATGAVVCSAKDWEEAGWRWDPHP